jgi:DNA-3-methyladenine glycosylase II
MPFLRVPEPYDFALSTERFRAFGPDRANLWHEDGLHDRIEPVVRKLLGLEFDLDAFYAWAAVADETLARLTVALRGFRPPLAPDPFESVVTSITAQQVSLHSAFAIRNRLIERYGVRGGLARGFPTARRLARAREGDLVALGFSRRKAEYVLGLARQPPDWDELALLPDAEVKARLTRYRGVGEWTADWFLARHLARPEAWPAGDLGLRKAVASFYRERHDVRGFGERFAPFQNLVAHYLLTGLRVAP